MKTSFIEIAISEAVAEFKKSITEIINESTGDTITNELNNAENEIHSLKVEKRFLVSKHSSEMHIVMHRASLAIDSVSRDVIDLAKDAIRLKSTLKTSDVIDVYESFCEVVINCKTVDDVESHKERFKRTIESIKRTL